MENDMKQQARDKKGELLDSINLTMGTAGKGTAVTLKCYINLLVVAQEDEEDTDTEIKVKNLFRLRQMMIDKGLVLS